MSVDYKVRIIYADVIDKVTKTEEAWKDVCRLAGQIYRYEFDNVLMVYAQKPSATLVADYDSWKKVDRYVKRGSKGIVVYPSRALSKSYIRHVFDPVFEGAGSVQLNEGIGHMTNTTELCGKGNCVLAGHNGSRRGVYFTYLCNIEAGAKVLLTNRKKEKHEYTVKEMKVVNPYDEWVTEQTEEESLTLFTCAEHGTKRFVVKCEPVNNTDQQDGEKTDRRKGGGAIGSK